MSQVVLCFLRLCRCTFVLLDNIYSQMKTLLRCAKTVDLVTPLMWSDLNHEPPGNQSLTSIGRQVKITNHHQWELETRSRAPEVPASWSFPFPHQKCLKMTLPKVKAIVSSWWGSYICKLNQSQNKNVKFTVLLYCGNTPNIIVIILIWDILLQYVI